MSGPAAYITLEELADALGDAAAARLVAAVGGERLYVPRRFRQDSEIVVAIGQTAADRLSEHIVTGHGGMWIELPRGGTGSFQQLSRRLAELCAREDLSERDVARLAGVTTRAVRARRAKTRAKCAELQARLL